MIENAEREGLGDPTRLRRSFSQFRKYGLIGGYVEKSSRKGGEGLWHPIQFDLFFCYLRNIKESGTRPGGAYRGDLLHKMASIPVGAWLFKEPGITINQAKMCLNFQWGKRLKAIKTVMKRPGTSNRSDLGKSVKNYIHEISIIPTTNPKRSRGLIQRLSDIVLYSSMDSFSQATWDDAIAQFLEDESPKDSKYISDEWRFQLDCFLCGLLYMRRLVMETALVDELWQWAREVYQYDLRKWRRVVNEAQYESPEIVKDFIDPVFGLPTIDNVLLIASRDILRYLGLGIKHLLGEIDLRKNSRYAHPRAALKDIINR